MVFKFLEEIAISLLFMNEIEKKVSRFIAKNDLLQGIKTLVVGFSGGPDSTVLLLILHKVFANTRAVHFHHGLRGAEADKDEEWCRKFCLEKRIPYQLKRLNVSQNQQKRESLEMAGRRLRLENWKRILGEHKHSALALGHHLDDKLENFLIRFVRGSNLSGLTGLKPISEIQGIRIIRPLLFLEKNELITYLQILKVHYRTDKTNQDDKHWRNAIRNNILPRLYSLAGNKGGMIKSLDFLENEAEILEKEVQKKVQEKKCTKLFLTDLLELDGPLQIRYLKKWLYMNHNFKFPLRGTLINNLLSNLSKSSCNNRKFELSKDHTLELKNGIISLQKRQNKVTVHQRLWHWSQNPELELPELNGRLSACAQKTKEITNFKKPNCVYWDPSFLGKSLLIRARKPGDRMHPFGQLQRVRVKKLISNAKLGPDQKQKLFVICDQNDEIIWIPGVRRADYGKIGKHCQQCIQLTFERIDETSHQ